MIRKNKNRLNARISRIAFLGILLLAPCASLFSQSQGVRAGKTNQGYGKMVYSQPALRAAILWGE